LKQQNTKPSAGSPSCARSGLPGAIVWLSSVGMKQSGSRTTF